MNSIAKQTRQHNKPKWYPLLEQAHAYHAMGMNVVPLSRGKLPIIEWRNGKIDFATIRQTIVDVNQMKTAKRYKVDKNHRRLPAWPKAHGIAVLTGPVSGNLVCIDFDKQNGSRELVGRFLTACDLPLDYEWLNGSPSGNYHVWLRTDATCNEQLTGNTTGIDDRYNDTVIVDSDSFENAPHIELRYSKHYAGMPAPGSKRAFLNTDTFPKTKPALVTHAKLRAAYLNITGERRKKTKNRPVASQDAISHTLDDGRVNQYRLYVRDAAMRAWHFGPDNGHGYSPNIHCPNPSHDDRNPSAAWCYENKETGATDYLHCQSCGGLKRDDIAADLGLMTFTEFVAERHAQTTTAATVAQEPAPVSTMDSEPTPDVLPTRFGGYPETYHKRTVTRHTLIDVQSQKHAAFVAFLWEQVADYLPDDVFFSIGDFQEAHTRYLADHGIATGAITMHAAKVGLDQLVAGGEVLTEAVSAFGDIAHPSETPEQKSNSKKCNTVYVWRYLNNGVAKFAIWRRKTRTKKVYRFKPVDQRLAAWVQKQHYAERENAYTKHNAPDNVQPEWCDTSEQVEAWQQYRAPLYADPVNEDRRAKASDWYETGAGHTDSAADRILANRFNVIDLPPQPLPNATAFLDAIRTYARDVVHKGEIDRASDLSKWTGRERSTEARARERTGGITVQHSKIVACEAVKDYEWQYNLATDLGGGKARVSYRGEKSLSTATEDEQRRFEAVSAAKKEARDTADPNANQETPAPAATIADGERQPLTVPANYTAEYKQRQYEYYPLVGDDIPDHDHDTGEVDVWRVGGKWLLTQGKVATMPTYTAFTAECEALDEPPPAIDSTRLRAVAMAGRYGPIERKTHDEPPQKSDQLVTLPAESGSNDRAKLSTSTTTYLPDYQITRDQSSLRNDKPEVYRKPRKDFVADILSKQAERSARIRAKQAQEQIA